MEAPLYDSPFSAFEEELIPEVATFKEEGLVIPEGWEGEKGKLKIYWGELNPGHLHEIQECWPLRYPNIVLL